MLGGRSGVALARELRGEQPTLPVLLVSGYPELDDATDEDPLPLLQKPFTEAELRQAVATALAPRP